jgi:hypothetical protein
VISGDTLVDFGQALERALSSSSGLTQLHALEVRVLEARGVLQPVSDRTIDADVREPDQAELSRGLGVDDESDGCEDDGRCVGVCAAS